MLHFTRIKLALSAGPTGGAKYADFILYVRVMQHQLVLQITLIPKWIQRWCLYFAGPVGPTDNADSIGVLLDQSVLHLTLIP